MKIPRITIPSSILELFQKGGRVKTLKSKEHLLMEGDTSSHCYFLEQGVLRYYATTETGDEVTRVFLKSGDLPLAYRFFTEELRSQPSFYSIQSLGKSRLKTLPWGALVELITKNHEAALYFLRKYEEIYFYRERALKSTAKQARQNYREFLDDYSEILPHLNNRIIASYLDISPESLSRLKRLV